MKAVGVFQFYFSYVLPRGSDWPKRPLGIQLGQFVVGIRPRAPDEPLFPDTIDQTLSGIEFQLERRESPLGRGRTVVRESLLRHLRENKKARPGWSAGAHADQVAGRGRRDLVYRVHYADGSR